MFQKERARGPGPTFYDFTREISQRNGLFSRLQYNSAFSVYTVPALPAVYMVKLVTLHNTVITIDIDQL